MSEPISVSNPDWVLFLTEDGPKVRGSVNIKLKTPFVIWNRLNNLILVKMKLIRYH